jgi:magnesium chelatase subunit D
VSAAAPAVYPLAALVGQRKMVEALLILAVDPAIGGLLLVGEKGTAKSTAARALAELLPAEDSRGTPAPFRTVPLGVTEDRLLGGLDWEAAVKNGRPALKAGLLREAHGGLVYIDEVNLLEPSLGHLLLDVVSSGRVTLEREGLSASCPARVALLATMNPEEGRLGPQLADRFAMTVELTGEADPGLRAEVVRRRLRFEADPAGFRAEYAGASDRLRREIAKAREFLPKIVLGEKARGLIARLAGRNRLAGHRGDLALARAALARAALLDLESVGPAEIMAVAGLILPSRSRPAPAAERVLIKAAKAEKAGRREDLFEAVYVADVPEVPPDYKEDSDGENAAPTLTVFKSESLFNIVTPQKKRDVGPQGRSGRRGARETGQALGRAYRTTARRLGRPLSLAATLRAAAPFQLTRKNSPDAAFESRPLILTAADFREKVYRLKTGRLVIFVVDSSGSIGTLYRMEEAKAAALSILSEAYRKRDRVALIAFYGPRAELLLPPTNSPDLAGRLLAELPSGGKTPLASALVMAARLLKTELAKDPALSPYVVLMTDGRPNIPLEAGVNPWSEALTLAGLLAADPRLRFLLIDTDRGAYNDYKLTRELAERLRAPRINLEELREGRLESWLAEN